MEERKEKRIEYFDNLKILAVFLVLVAHASIAYIPQKSWYFKDGSVEQSLIYLVTPFTIFPVAVFFLISGYFSKSRMKKIGYLSYMKARLIRLGIPFLIFLPISNLIFFYTVYKTSPPLYDSYFKYLLSNLLILFSGSHLWFLSFLLFISLSYALISYFFNYALSFMKKSIQNFFPSLSITIIILMFLITHFFRMKYSDDYAIFAFDFFRFKPVLAPIFIGSFIFGVLLFKNEFYMRLNSKWGLVLLFLGLFSGYLYDNLFYGLQYFSNFYVADLLETALFFLLGLCTTIGVLILFREKFNHQNEFFKKLTRNVYPIYIVHSPIVVYLQFLLLNYRLPGFVKFLLVFTSASILSFLVTNYLMQRINFFKKILF